MFLQLPLKACGSFKRGRPDILIKVLEDSFMKWATHLVGYSTILCLRQVACVPLLFLFFSSKVEN